jgi:hypothetical protein
LPAPLQACTGPDATGYLPAVLPLLALLLSGHAHAAPDAEIPPAVGAAVLAPLAAPGVDAILAMDANSAPARLDRLIAARALDDAGLRALGARDPVLVHQLLDPAARAALDYVLALPPAEIRHVRDGQAVVRGPASWGGEEGDRLVALCRALGENPRRVWNVHVHTHDAQVLQVDLETRRDTLGTRIAYPPAEAPVDAVASIRAWLGIPAPAARTPLTDPSFESAASLGLAWVVDAPAGTSARRDPARHARGAASARLATDAAPVQLSQALDLRLGDSILVGVEVALEGGGDARARVVFVGADGAPLLSEGAEARARRDEQGWQPLRLAAIVPPDAEGARLELSLAGTGSANFDDVRVALDGTAPAPLGTWVTTPSGAIELRADPARVPDPAAAAARIDQALRSGAVRVSIAVTGTITVQLFADEAHRRALARPTPPGSTLPPRPFVDDPVRGVCWQTADTPYVAACPIRVLVQRSWGEPGNAVLAEGLPRALAGSGIDFDAAVRPGLRTLPSLAHLAADWTDTPEQRDAAASFAGWLLRTQGQAAVRAAWQTFHLDAIDVAGRNLAALEAAWRADLGGGSGRP